MPCRSSVCMSIRKRAFIQASPGCRGVVSSVQLDSEHTQREMTEGNSAELEFIFPWLINEGNGSRFGVVLCSLMHEVLSVLSCHNRTGCVVFGWDCHTVAQEY